jgi:hypothetical protein
VLTSATQEPPLDVRYRRTLSFGDVLDESVQLYRRHWQNFVLISAVWLLPPGLVGVWLAASGMLDTTFLLADAQRGTIPSPSSLAGFAAALVASSVVGVLFLLGWSAATVAAADAYLHATDPSLRSTLARTLRRYVPTFISACLYGLGLIVLSVVSLVPLAIVPIIFASGIPAAIIGGFVWLIVPRARAGWLKWLIILMTPLGLPAYFGGAWSMFIGATMIERHGPIGALGRSMQLVDRHWWRVVSILTIGGLIVGVLQYAPSTLVQIPLTVSSATRGRVGLAPAELAISTAVGVIVQVLFASLASIVYTLLYVDLRNRREGTDIAERLSYLEAFPRPLGEG